MTRSGLLVQAPSRAGPYEQVSAFSVFSSNATPWLGTLCGSACGSKAFPGFANNLSSCHSPNVAACKPTAVTPLRLVHRWVSSPGSDRHNDSPAPSDTLGVRSIQIPQLHIQPVLVVHLLRKF